MCDSNRWLEIRKNGIGGSDCSAVFGLNPYISNVKLWEIKTGRKAADDLSQKSCVSFGKEAEAKLIKRFAEENKEKYFVSHKEYDMVFSKKYDFMFGTLDGVLIDKDTGEKGILEIKTCSVNKYNKPKWEGGRIPDNYYCQVLHYMAVTGYKFAVLYVMFYGFFDYKSFKKYFFFRDTKKEEEIKYLEEKESDFWNNYVLKDKKPDLLFVI